MFPVYSIRRLSRAARTGSRVHPAPLTSQRVLSPSPFLGSFQWSLPAILDSLQSSLHPFLLETSAEALRTFCFIDAWSSEAASGEAKQRLLSADYRSYGAGDKTECSAGDSSSYIIATPAGHFSSVIRHGQYFVPRSFYDAHTSGEGWDGGARPYGFVFQSRGYAAKTKKAKSRTEEVFDLVEDVGVTAKETAVKMMETALDVLSKEHSKLRTGRASAGMLDHIIVEAHGVRTPLSHIAAVTVSGLQTLNVLPYDASMVKDVERSILTSPLGLNPQVDGATLTVPLPRLTKEHCETMCKLAGKAGENAKLTIRRARKEALDSAKKSGSLSKDEIKRFEKEVEELTKKYTKSIDETCKKKEKEIMA